MKNIEEQQNLIAIPPVERDLEREGNTFMRFIKLTGLVLGSLLLVNAASAAAQVIVQVRPPHAFVERRGHPPGPGYVWVPGYQRWDGRGYVWTPGQWRRPPRPHAHWVPSRWVKHGHVWQFREGYWQ